MCIHKKTVLSSLAAKGPGAGGRSGWLTRAAQVALVALLPIVGACQGALTLTDGGTGSGGNDQPDMSTGPTNPDTVSFADINRDLQDSAYGCTLASPICHGGSNPKGILVLQDNALVDMAKLMANYEQVKTRVNTAMPDQSMLLLKVLSTTAGGTMHSGNKPVQDTNDAVYRRWLQWIQLGAKFEPVSTTGGGN